MDEQTELLREMVSLLRLIAEPQIAIRDERLRTSLIEIIGKGVKKAKAVSLMDGTRGPSVISRESGLDTGNLSRLIKSLRETRVVIGEEKAPKLAIPLPPRFLEEVGGNNA